MLRDRSTDGSAEPTCSKCKPVSGDGVFYENSCQSSAPSAVAPKRDSAVNHMVLAEETTEFGASQDLSSQLIKMELKVVTLTPRFQLMRFYKTVGLV